MASSEQEQIDNGALDFAHIADLASVTNPTALTATNRAGAVRITWTGLVAQLNAAYAITQTGANSLAALASKNAAAVSEANALTYSLAAQQGANMASSFAAGVAYSTATTGAAAFFWVRRGGLAADGVTVLARNTLFQRTSTTAATGFAKTLDADEFDSLIQITPGARSGYAAAWIDSTGAFAFAIRNDGKVIFGNGGDIVARVLALESAIPSIDVSTPRNGYASAVLDTSGFIAMGLDSNGNVISKGMNVTRRVAQLTPEFFRQITPSNVICCWGDSLTALTWPTKLSALLGRPVLAFGSGGQTSTGIALRQGGLVPFYSLPGNVVPASGSVAATPAGNSSTVSPGTSVSPFTGLGIQSMPGTIGGVPCLLSRNSDESLTLTRAVAGAAVPIDAAAPFIFATDGHDSETVVICVGRNNFMATAQVLADIAAMVATLKSLNKRFVVMSPPNANYPGEYLGQPGYDAIVALETAIMRTYPRNYVLSRPALIRAYNPGIAQDVIDVGRGVVPSSLRGDEVHWNGSGDAVIANLIYQFIVSAGY